VYRASLTSLLYILKLLSDKGGPLFPTLRVVWLASLLLGELQRRLEVRAISPDYEAAAETTV
jgi:hypothetical protein